MKNFNLLGLLLCFLLSTGIVSAQISSANDLDNDGKSPAYVALVSHKVKVEADLRNLRTQYTETFPSVISKKFELEITQREIAKILVIPKSKSAILSDSYGNLVVSKINAELKLRNLLASFRFGHPKVIEASNELQTIENEVSELLK